jgi:hypothetical protein
MGAAPVKIWQNWMRAKLFGDPFNPRSKENDKANLDIFSSFGLLIQVMQN